ncbi:MAG TPA: Rieske (2Fe-2S) protein [Nocardioides sp.]
MSDAGVPSALGRRGFVRGVGAAGVATGAVTAVAGLAGCGGPEVSTAGGTAGDVLVATRDVPVGGGVVLEEHGVVVTQPTAGDFRGFSSACTHRSCQVTRVEDGAIACVCHQSLFEVTDGAVRSGPADEPLPPVAVAIAGDDVVRA